MDTFNLFQVIWSGPLNQSKHTHCLGNDRWIHRMRLSLFSRCFFKWASHVSFWFDEWFNSGFWIINVRCCVSSLAGTKEEWELKRFRDLNVFNTRVISCCHSVFQQMEFPVENGAASPPHIILVQWLVIIQMQFVLAVDSINILFEHTA